MLKIEVKCKHSIREKLYPFSCTWHYTQSKTSAPLERKRAQNVCSGNIMKSLHLVFYLYAIRVATVRLGSGSEPYRGNPICDFCPAYAICVFMSKTLFYYNLHQAEDKDLQSRSVPTVRYSFGRKVDHLSLPVTDSPRSLVNPVFDQFTNIIPQTALTVQASRDPSSYL